MSRELKFRIWDKKESEYMCLGATGIDALTGEVVDYYLDATTLEKEDYIIEQYTGLKDKNGKEIYEGDIIRVDSFFDYETVSDYEVAWDEDFLSYHLKCIQGVNYDNDLGDISESACEIIGNIHENQERMKDEK